MQKIDLSIVLACYNEEKIFNQSLTEIVRVLQELSMNSEIILVDDSSQDRTRDLIDQFIANYQLDNPVLGKLFHEKNYGRGKTVADGFRMARGNFVGYLDIDLEVPAYYIPEFVRALKDGCDAAIAHRVYSVPILQFHRWILSRGYSFLVRLLLKLPFSDTEAGFKFFRRDKILPLLDKIKDEGWFWDTEIMVQSFANQFNIKVIPALFIKKPEKKSTVNVFKDSFDYFFKLFQFRKQLQFVGRKENSHVKDI